ncbi:DNA-directed DNA polymerase gamma mip1 [Mortierella sp. AM989]|nr:DNA-directed DNA polymerase gamma mip1 [Mortierella sp. AM989]
MTQRLVLWHPWRQSHLSHKVIVTTPTVTSSSLRCLATALPRPHSRPTNTLLATTLAKTNRWSPSRKNKVDVQMLHPDLHSRVFPSPSSSASASATGSTFAAMDPTPEMVDCAISHLKKQNLWGKKAIPVPNTTFPVPPLRGQNIEDHFYNIGVHGSATYKELAVTFAQSQAHPPPKQWLLRAGWTRYGKDGSVAQVEYPEERILTFDVETVPNLSKYPVMACATSSEAWYGWVSPWLIDPLTKDGKQNDHHLISFGPSRSRDDERVLVGHCVGYDRARVLEEYSLEQNGIRYLDTMSLHVAVSGLCTQQRGSWLKYSKALDNGDEEYIRSFKETTGKYFDVSSVNSLLQVSKFHCGIHMDKAPRNILLEATAISQIQESFQDLMTYCGRDVVATNAVYQKTFPKFLERCPHPVSFAGMLQMGSSFLTVNEGWTDYIARCNKKYMEMSQSVESKLLLLAENAVKNFESDPEFYKSDPWLSQLDWNLPKRVWKEGVKKKDGGYRKGQEPRWKCQAKILPDKPEWYRGLWDSKAQRIKLSTRQRVAPLLLKMQWRGYPLVYSDLHGWTFRVPKDDSEFTAKTTELVFTPEDEAGYQATIDPDHYRYYRVPHNGGEGMNVGNPLSKGYISHFEHNVLSSYAADGTSAEDGSAQIARQALDMNAQCAYWVSARERIENQFVVWDKEVGNVGKGMGLPDRGEGRSGIILPQIITMGTVTRRAVEKTWMTASNAKKNRIGSELKSMVEAPAGYKIVGADVDSEELWISSLMGDAQFRMHGATALGWMTLQGTKTAGTDLHSKTALILGISRDQAKIFNYGRIYGAGVKFAARLMQQFNSTIDAAEAKKRATDLYIATKGVKQQKALDYKLVTDRPFWHGGSESYMFNSLEGTATEDDPRTPVLSCGITDALKPKHTENQFMTSRVNWVVQSSGVDYLHMLLVSMNYLIKKYDINARFMLCVHDEVRYMVKEEDTARATLALQVSNLWTRALFSYKLGIHDLPQSVAFFSSVDVDHVFRKEVNMDCLTPTQGTAIPHGKSLTIEGVLELTQGGNLGEVSKGFQDAAENSFPLELRTSKERHRLQLAQPDASVDPSQLMEIQHKQDTENLFLKVQSMDTLREIKMAIKQQQIEAELKARMLAEKAASRANGNDGETGQSGGIAHAAKIPRAKPKELRRSLVTQSRRVAQAKSAGVWGAKMDQPSTSADDKKITPKVTTMSKEDIEGSTNGLWGSDAIDEEKINSELSSEKLLQYFREKSKFAGNTVAPKRTYQSNKSSNGQFRKYSEQDLRDRKIDYAAAESSLWGEENFVLGEESFVKGGRSETVIVDATPEPSSSSEYFGYFETPKDATL